jgi:hypothetical protein
VRGIKRGVSARSFGLGLLAVAICVGASASASTRTSSTNVPAGTQQFGRVACPSGQHVKSFGVEGQFAEFEDAESDLPVELALVNPSHVIAGARSTDTTPGSFDTTAVCGHAPGLSGVAAGDDVAAGVQKSISAKCPRGSSVRLGGFRQEIGPVSTPGAFVMINGLERKRSRTWKVSAINVGDESGRLTAFAYCGAPVHDVHAVEKTKNVRSGHYGTATARCPRGMKFVTGGLRIQHYETYAGDIYVTAMGPAGRRGWTVTGFKFQPVSGHLTAIAYCSG